MNLDFHTVGAKTIVRHFYQKNYSIVFSYKIAKLNKMYSNSILHNFSILSLNSAIHQTFLLILPHSGFAATMM